jgi:hypothetical protein
VRRQVGQPARFDRIEDRSVLIGRELALIGQRERLQALLRAQERRSRAPFGVKDAVVDSFVHRSRDMARRDVADERIERSIPT